MLEELRDLHRNLGRLKNSLPKPLTKQVKKKDVKEQTRALVDKYFRDVRTSLLKTIFAEIDLTPLDINFQHLLEFSRRHVTAATYNSEIKEALELVARFEQITLLEINSLENSDESKISDEDELIIQTLKGLVPSAAASYHQATIDLQQENRSSWRGPATDLREALRETLDHVAPDDEVRAQRGFKLEANTVKPTMKQKTRFILSKRKQNKKQSAPTENAVATVEEIIGSFVRSVYTQSNISTHTSTEKEEVLKLRRFVRVVMSELLELPYE